MKVLLTGITGSLGYEVALELNKRGLAIIPVLRSRRGKDLNFNELPRTKSPRYPLESSFLLPHFIRGLKIHGFREVGNKITFEDVIDNDLMDDEEIVLKDSVNCIVHCAGNIHFSNTGNSNEKMTVKVIKLAKRMKIPLYLISTAYIYRPSNISQKFNNAYELDKFRSEQALISSGVKYGIFRPSVLVGNSKSGEIQNFSGYYSIVKAFYAALTSSKQKGKKLRFPDLPGKSNLIPVDQAAYYISNEIQNLKFRTLYITNPNSPKASWVLKQTLDFFNLGKTIELVEISFDEYGKLKLTVEEQTLYDFIKYYYPYWAIAYDFPASICNENLINHDYLVKTLTFLSSSNFSQDG